MNTTDQALEKIAHGTILAFVGIFISKILGYAYRLIAARFGPAEYGLLSLGLALFNVLMIIAMLGLNQGVLRYISFYRTKKDYSNIKGTILSATGITTFFSLILATLVFLLSDWIANSFFHEPRLGLVFKIISFVIPFDAVKNILFNIIRAFENVTYEIYSRNIVETLTKVLFTLLFLILGYKLLGATIAFDLALLISFFMALFYTSKVFPQFNTTKASYTLKKLLTYSLPLVINNLTILVMLWTDTLLIGYFKTPTDVGIYNAAAPTAAMMYLFPQALLALFLPVLTGLYAQNNLKDFNTVYRIAVKWITLTNAALLSLFILLSVPLLHLFFGASYISGAAVLIILSLGYFIYYIALISNNILLIYEKTTTILYASSAGSILNILLNILLIPHYGIAGAALATSLSYLVVSIIFFIITYKLTSVRLFDSFFFKELSAATLATLISFFLLHSLSLSPIFTLLIISSFFTLTYIFFILFFRILETHDLVMLKELEKRLKINLSWLETFLKKYISKNA